jgi:hypothetical protein
MVMLCPRPAHVSRSRSILSPNLGWRAWYDVTKGMGV